MSKRQKKVVCYGGKGGGHLHASTSSITGPPLLDIRQGTKRQTKPKYFNFGSFKNKFVVRNKQINK